MIKNNKDYQRLLDLEKQGVIINSIEFKQGKLYGIILNILDWFGFISK